MINPEISDITVVVITLFVSYLLYSTMIKCNDIFSETKKIESVIEMFLKNCYIFVCKAFCKAITPFFLTLHSKLTIIF